MLRRKTLLIAVLACAIFATLGAGSALASDQTIVGQNTFASLDGSAQDDGPAADGVLTVLGNLTIASGGSITCNDPASPTGASACPIEIDVGGSMDMQAGSAILAENNFGAGSGAPITIDVGATLTMLGGSPGARISSSDNVGGGTGGKAGDITITVGSLTATPPTGAFEMENGAQIQANGDNSQGGEILVTAGRTANVDGLVESAVDTGSTGTGATQGLDGGHIDITAGCGLTVSETGKVSSRGRDAGADLVHLEGCEVAILGKVESIASGGHATPNSPANHCNNSFRPGHPANSTGCIEVWGQNILIDAVNGNAELNTNKSGQCGGREWIEIFAEQDVTILGKTGAADPYVVHASHPCANTQTAGIITVKAEKGDVAMSGHALEADALNPGGTGGFLTIHAGGDVNLDTAFLHARGDFVATGGFGKGGKVGTLGGDGVGGGNADVAGIRSFNGTLTWTNGQGDVRPTGDALSAASRGEIVYQDCTAGFADVSGTTFPVNGAASTTPTELADDCGSNPSLPTYVDFKSEVWAACRPPEEATKSGRKFNDVQGDGFTGNGVNDNSDPGLENWEIRAYADNNPQNGDLDVAEFNASPVTTVMTGPTGAYSFTLSPGSYVFCEVLQSGWTQSFPSDLPAGECDADPSLGAEGYAVTLAAGDNHEGNDFGNFIECKWCTKNAVLSQVTQNMGVCCAVPDILVDLRGDKNDPVEASELGSNQPATGSIQKAVDYVNGPDWPANDPTPGDGEIFIGVTAKDCGTGEVAAGDGDASACAGQKGRGPNGGGTENVVIENTRSERLNVFGCSVDLNAQDPDKPVVTIKDGVGKVTVLDIHVHGSSVAGYLVENNDELVVVKNSRSFGASGIGYHVKDDNVQITGSPEISGHDIGILVEGSNVTLRTNNDINDNGVGIKITGDENESDGNDVGDDGHPNGTGILVEGKNNHLHGDSVVNNTGDGIVIAGSGTSLADGNFVEDEDALNNGDDGIVVSGNFNTLDRNKQIKNNTGDGIEVSGSSNLLNENAAAENTGHGVNVSGNSNTLTKNQSDENGGDGIRVGGDDNVLVDNSTDENTGNGIKADSADGAAGNGLEGNEANKNDLQGIRACGQTDNGDNDGDDNGVNPQVDFVCAVAGPAVFFVADENPTVYKYDAAGILAGSFALHNDNDDPSGVAVVGSDVYVLDSNDDRVYRYDAATGAHEATSRKLEQFITLGNSLGTPGGLAISGDDLWLADDGNTELLHYSVTSAFGAGGDLSAIEEIDLTGDNGSAQGLAIDAGCLYVLDDADKKFYRYDRPEVAGACAPATSKLLKEVGGTNLGTPTGATLQGTSLWVVDKGKDKAYGYDDLAALFAAGVSLNASSEFGLDPANGDAAGV